MVRRVAAGLTTALACLLVWFALVAPDRLGSYTAAAFVRVPLEGLLLVAVVLVLPDRARRVAAVVVGVVLGVLTVVRLLDLGFTEALGRPFDPWLDRAYLGSAVSLLSDSRSDGRRRRHRRRRAAVGRCCWWRCRCRCLRLARIVDGHREVSVRAAGVLAAVWALCAVLGLQVVAGAPIASASVIGLADDHVSQVRTDLADQQAFARTAAVDAYRSTPGSDLLTGLRGKDVIVAFVESYGRVAVQGSSFSPGVDAVLDAGTSSCMRPGSRRRARCSRRRPSAGSAGWPTPRCSPGCGSTASSATTTWSAATASP